MKLFCCIRDWSTRERRGSGQTEADTKWLPYRPFLYYHALACNFDSSFKKLVFEGMPLVAISFSEFSFVPEIYRTKFHDFGYLHIVMSRHDNFDCANSSAVCSRRLETPRNIKIYQPRCISLHKLRIFTLITFFFWRHWGNYEASVSLNSINQIDYETLMLFLGATMNEATIFSIWIWT